MHARGSAVLLCACVACVDPVGPFHPQGQGELVPLNRVIEDFISDSVPRLYSFEAAIDGEYVVLLKAYHGSVSFLITDGVSTVTTYGSAAVTIPLEENPSFPLRTPLGGSGSIRAQVFNGDTARFQFKIVPVHTPPEIAPRRFEWGDTLRGETINPLWDTDVFVAHAQAGQTIAAALEPLGTDPGAIWLTIESENGQFLGQVENAPGTPLRSTGAIPVSVSQDYRLVVRRGFFRATRHQGEYRVWSYLINRAPERAPVTLPKGVVRADERIDQPNDIDEFTFQDTVGAEYLAFFDARRHFSMFIYSPTDSFVSGRIGGSTDTTLLHQGTVLFQLQSAGPYKVKVDGGYPGDWLMADTGAYRVLLFPVDRRPENVPATFQVGDTVRGEAIFPAGEIDEFTASATPGAQLMAGMRVTADPQPQFDYVELLVLDDGTGTALAQIAVQTTGAFQTASFTVPPSGTLRVRLGRQICCPPGRAPYEFFLRPAP